MNLRSLGVMNQVCERIQPFVIVPRVIFQNDIFDIFNKSEIVRKRLTNQNDVLKKAVRKFGIF